MDPRLLQYYNLELQHLRETGAEFAEQFPKIAARLGMHGLEVADPYVERLLEGVGVSGGARAAQARRRVSALHAGAARDRLSALPGADAVDAGRAAQAGSERSEPGRRARRCRAAARCPALLAADDATACEFRTAQDVTLWPIEIVSASYFSFAPDLPLNTLPIAQRIKGGVRIRLKTTAGLKFAQTAIDRLCFYLAGPRRRGEQAVRAVSGDRSGRAGAAVERADAVARVAAGGGDPAGRLRRRRGAAAGDAALVSGLPAAAGIFFVSAALSLLRADRARAGAQAGRRGPGRARDSPRPRRADARERRRSVESGAVLHAGDQSVPQARRPDSCQRQRATSITSWPTGRGRWISRSTR